MTSSRYWVRVAGFLILLELVLLVPEASAYTATPNDPLLKSQWGWFDVLADRAFNTSYHGQNVIVAVLDTGVDTGHPDLKANLIQGRNFVTGEDPSNYTDTVGHGTMVAGIIAAVANNSIGIAGVAPLVKIMPLKVLDPTGSIFNIDQAIAYAITNGANVINMSFGSNTTLDAASQSEIRLAYSQGVVLVAAAGNNNSSSPFYPAAYNDSVIPVSALNPSNHKSSYSNFGSYIELAAPGDDICSTYLANSYKCGFGTSFAAPFVSATVALMLSKNSSMTPSDVRNALNREAINLGSSWSEHYGYGLVNACAAVSHTCPSSPGWTNGNSIPPLSLSPLIIALFALTLPIIWTWAKKSKWKSVGLVASLVL